MPVNPETDDAPTKELPPSKQVPDLLHVYNNEFRSGSRRHFPSLHVAAPLHQRWTNNPPDMRIMVQRRLNHAVPYLPQGHHRTVPTNVVTLAMLCYACTAWEEGDPAAVGFQQITHREPPRLRRYMRTDGRKCTVGIFWTSRVTC